MIKKYELPLSWLRAAIDAPQIKEIPLPRSKSIWLALGEIPFDRSFDEVVEQLPQGRYVIRGCTPSPAQCLAERGWQCVQSGVEALLHLQNDPTWPKKLRHSIRRAQQELKFYELPLNEKNQMLLHQLEAQTRFARRPKLRHVFRLAEAFSQRLFVAVDEQNNFQAAFTVSLNAPGHYQGELMLRNACAPFGAMEGLIDFVYRTLAAEKAQYLSLGEVPFVLHKTQNLKERVIKWGGYSILPAYDFKGLYFFKNKFKPQWRPVFLCATPALSIGLMTELLVASGTFALWKEGLRKVSDQTLTGLHRAAAFLPAILGLFEK